MNSLIHSLNLLNYPTKGQQSSRFRRNINPHIKLYLIKVTCGALGVCRYKVNLIYDDLTLHFYRKFTQKGRKGHAQPGTQ